MTVLCQVCFRGVRAPRGSQIISATYKDCALALKRTETARDYLVAKGIDAGRLEVQSYSFDWARVEAEKGKSEGKNRRVQVWLHK